MWGTGSRTVNVKRSHTRRLGGASSASVLDNSINHNPFWCSWGESSTRLQLKRSSSSCWRVWGLLSGGNLELWEQWCWQVGCFQDRTGSPTAAPLLDEDRYKNAQTKIDKKKPEGKKRFLSVFLDVVFCLSSAWSLFFFFFFFAWPGETNKPLLSDLESRIRQFVKDSCSYITLMIMPVKTVCPFKWKQTKIQLTKMSQRCHQKSFLNLWEMHNVESLQKTTNIHHPPRQSRGFFTISIII